VIVATGLYWDVPHYFAAQSGRSVEFIADFFVRDIQDGIMDTGVKAGIIKCATDEPGMTPGVERVILPGFCRGDVGEVERASGLPVALGGLESP